MTSAQKVDPNMPLREGEFRRIKGIAETTERALHEAGIETFEHLALMTPEEIAAALPGNVGVKERAARQDWMGQAASFTRLLPKHKSPEETEGKGMQQPDRQQHYASFMVVLLMDEEQEVRRTTVTHVQDDSRESWAGWEPLRMAGWIADQARISSENPAALQTPEKKPARLVQKRSENALKGELLFSPIQFIPFQRLWDSFGEKTLPAIFSGDPFSVEMELDLKQVESPQDKSLRYYASAQIRSLANWKQAEMITLEGEAYAGEKLYLKFEMPGLPEGAYHVDAAAFVAPEGSSNPQEEGLGAMTEGTMIHVRSRELVGVSG